MPARMQVMQVMAKIVAFICVNGVSWIVSLETIFPPPATQYMTARTEIVLILDRASKIHLVDNQPPSIFAAALLAFLLLLPSNGDYKLFVGVY